MDVRPPRPRCLAEVALREFGVLGAKHQTQPLKRHSISVNRIKRRNGDLDINNRLRVEPGHRRRTDVVDPEGDRTKGIPQPDAESRKETRPRRIVRTNFDDLRYGPPSAAEQEVQ